MASAKSVVMRSLDETGIQLAQLALSISESEFTFQPKFGASVQWTLAHIMCLEDWSVNRVIRKGKTKFSPAFRDAFKGGRPVARSDKALLPARDKLVADFRATREVSIAVLDGFSESRWDEQTPTDCRFPTLGTVWENFANDSWWHLGQLSVTIPSIAGTTRTIDRPRVYSVDTEEVRARLRGA